MYRTLVICCLILIVATPGLAQDPQPKKKAKPTWMTMKLNYTGKILEGMSTGDFKMIEEQAQGMRFVNKIETFVRQRPRGYRAQLRAFDAAITEIETMADKENMDGVTIAFNQLTLSCVQCHKQLRQANQLQNGR